MIVTVGAVVVLLAVSVLPHLLPLDGAAPLAAAGAWISGIGARALLVLLVVLGAAFYAPGPLVSAIGHWCVTLPIPGVGGGLAITGHGITQIMVLVPAVGAGWALCRAVASVRRDARRVRRLLADEVLWVAPGDAAVVPGDGVLVAAAGILRPRLLVSAGALVALDDEELAAGLDHERGHIRRGHRFILLVADVMLALARLTPGASTARLEVVYHLERDADQWSLRRDHEPAALARAICKAALAPISGPAMAGLASGRTVRRVETLLRTNTGISPRRRTITGLSLGLAMAAVLTLFSVPATAAAGFHVLQDHQPERHCID